MSVRNFVNEYQELGFVSPALEDFSPDRDLEQYSAFDVGDIAYSESSQSELRSDNSESE